MWNQSDTPFPEDEGADIAVSDDVVKRAFGLLELLVSIEAVMQGKEAPRPPRPRQTFD